MGALFFYWLFSWPVLSKVEFGSISVMQRNVAAWTGESGKSPKG
jgi:hypothetical protein